MKQPRKVALINVHDYNRDKYTTYYEIRVIESPEGYLWGARIYDRKQEVFKIVERIIPASNFEGIPIPEQKIIENVRTGNLIREEAVNTAKTRDEADTAAQLWIKDRMEAYRKPKPMAMPIKSEAGYIHILGPGWMVGEAIAESIRRLFRPFFEAISYSTTVRNAMLAALRDAIDGGAGAGLFRIYDGSRPATCGAATTLLAELTFSDPSAGAPAAGVLTFSAITADASANATGTATWFRGVDSTGTCCMDGNVNTAASDLNLNNTSIAITQNVAVSSAVITEGNP